MAELYKIRSTKNKNKSLDKNPFFNEIKSFLDQYKPAVENTTAQTSDTSGNIETVGIDEKLDQFESAKVQPLDTRINLLTGEFGSLNSNTEALITALTDEGKINLAQLKAKIQSVKPKELQTMRSNISTNTASYTDLKLKMDRLIPLADNTSVDVLANTTKLQNNQNILTSMQKANKLQLNDTYFNGEIYFMNCGEWGLLEGLITLKDTLPRNNVPVCPIDFNYPYEGYCVFSSAINAFKIENKNIYITKPDLSIQFGGKEIKFYSIIYKKS